MKNKELKPCPLCHEKPIFIDNLSKGFCVVREDKLYTIKCSNGCDISVSSNFEEYVFDCWNDLVERIEKHLESEVEK